MTEQEYEVYDLFRRAIVFRDPDAWADIHARYRTLLIAWALRHCTLPPGADAPEEIADHALARAWAALTPERFEEFGTLSHLMSYLRACVVTTAIDARRTSILNERLTQQVAANIAPSPELGVLRELANSALWNMLLQLVRSPAERVVLIESFVHSCPPRDIQARYSQLFPEVMQVYAVKRNLFARLQRNQGLMQFYKEFVSN